MMIHQNHKSESKKQFNILKYNKFSNIMEFFYIRIITNSSENTNKN